MNKRQKYIAACVNPFFQNFATREEVEIAKDLAKGRYWDEPDYCTYCSFSPKGKRTFYEYSDDSKLIAKKSAALWAKGECDKANKLYCEIYDE